MTRSRFLLSIMLLLAAAHPAPAQDRSAARLAELVRGLTITPRVLIVGARPGEEDADLIAWLARGQMIQTGYLALSRAESSPNHAGIESGVALGAIHVEEALAARRIDGGEQFFTRAYDFGPARNADEVFKRWDHDTVLSSVVAAVRAFRPHVIISLFTKESTSDGHQQASAILAREAFDAAFDTVRFKRATYGRAWGATAYYEPGAGVMLHTRGYDRMRGTSIAELAVQSRAHYRTLGFERLPWQPAALTGLRRVSVRGHATAPAGADATASLFDGVDTSFARLKLPASPGVSRQLDALAAYADTARQMHAAGAMARTTAALARASEIAATIRNTVPTCKHPSRDATVSIGERRSCDVQWMDLDASIDLVQARVNEALLVSAGVRFQAVADREFVSNRDTAMVTITAWNDGEAPLALNDVTVSGTIAVRMTTPLVLAPHDSVTLTRQLVRIADAHPWWIWARKRNFYPDVTTPLDGVPHIDLMSAEFGVSGAAIPENIRRLTDVVATLTIGGTSVTTSVASVVYRIADPLLGVRDRAVSGVPAVTLGFERALEWAVAGKPLRKQLRLVLKSFSDRAIPMSLRASGGGAARIDSLPPTVEVPARGGVELRVPVRGTIPQGRYEMGVTGVNVPDEYGAGFRTAQYPHLPVIHLFRNSTVNVQAVDVDIPARLNVAYVRGVGEDTDVALKQLGIPAYVFNDEGLMRYDLDDFTTIVIGPGAYETNRGLYMQGARLAEFVRRGGTLVVLNNPAAAREPGVFPIPVILAQASGERVNAEDAPVRILDARAKVLAWPNAIRASDWSSWVGARAIGMPSRADARFAQVVEMHDAGEPENRNAILVGTLGKGRFVYTTVAFPQQIANGVAGAMRLFVNVLSAGLPAETKLAGAAP